MKSYRADQLQAGMRLVRYYDDQTDAWVDTNLTIRRTLLALNPHSVRVELDDGETLTLPQSTEFLVELPT